MKNKTSFWKNPGKEHGGATRAGKRKTARPLATKRPLHIVLKSSRAHGEWNLLKHSSGVKKSVYATAKRFGIRVFLYQNVGNHLHLAVQGRQRRQIQNFFRVLPQAIAYLVTQTRRGNPIGKFWDAPLFTRVVEWGRDWRNLKKYFEKNAWEAAGLPRALVDRVFRLAQGPGSSPQPLL